MVFSSAQRKKWVIFVCFNEFQEETLCAQTPTAPRCTESEITNQGVEDLTAQQSAGSADWMRVRHTPLRRAAHASAGLLSAKSLHLRLRGGVMLSCAGRYTTMSMWLAAVHVGCGREAKTRCKGSVRDEEAERDESQAVKKRLATAD